MFTRLIIYTLSIADPKSRIWKKYCMSNKNTLYLGTDVGVYVTKNAGESWEVLGNLPCTYVHDLAIHPRENVIIIATHGRGMFILDADPVNAKKEESN